MAMQMAVGGNWATVATVAEAMALAAAASAMVAESTAEVTAVGPRVGPVAAVRVKVAALEYPPEQAGWVVATMAPSAASTVTR